MTATRLALLPNCTFMMKSSGDADGAALKKGTAENAPRDELRHTVRNEVGQEVVRRELRVNCVHDFFRRAGAGDNLLVADDDVAAGTLSKHDREG